MLKSILITGATGKQGGGVINRLLSANANVEILAVTRNVQAASSLRLAGKSPKIKLVQGDLNDTPGMFKNARSISSNPIWGVFSVQSDFKREEQHGKALVDEALKNKVKYFVYTSVCRGRNSYSNPTDVPHFITKHNIEHHLVDSATNTDMDWTILRPVAFMDNQTPNFFGKVFATCWDMALKGKPLQVIAVSDIGHFGAEAFLNPEDPRYKRQAISLAGDELTYEQAAKVFRDKTGQAQPQTYWFIASLLMYMSKEFGYMFKWFHDVGFGTDIQAVRQIKPDLKDWKTWLETESQYK